MRISSLLVSVTALAAVACHPPEAVLTQPASPDPLRLSRDVVPKSYDLSLRIDPDAAEFSGHEWITISLAVPTRRIRLHGRDLIVTKAQFRPASEAGATQVLQYSQQTKDGAAALTSPVDLPAGDGTLEIEWHAPYSDRVNGLYIVKDGGRAYAFTQFESIFARSMFPCFDEPSFKTPFAVTLTVPASDVAVGNNLIASEHAVGDGTREVRFNPTLPLPTYLVALAVGPFDVVQGPDIPASDVRKKAVPLRGIAVHGKGPLFKYALDRAGKLVQILEKYFGIAYPWEKLDLLALPDFGPGAMENAGAITFKDWLVLIDPDNAPVDQTRAFASVTAHELAHQWFGDLVTMSWWDDTWLNEAFATWMGTHAVEEYDPSMKAELGLIYDAEGAMTGDSLQAARRIRQPVKTTDDIFNSFDHGITYQKGASVIGMFEQWTGAEKFRAGVQKYIESHRYGNGSTDDFLTSITASTGTDVSGPFHDFLDQPGVPMIDISARCGPRGAGLTLHAERYRPLGSTIASKGSWRIPLCLKKHGGSAGTEQTECTLIADDGDIPFVPPGCPDWFMPNSNGAGYYRFSLSGPEGMRLAKEAPGMPAAERLAYVDSVKASQKADRISIPEAYDMLAPFADADDRRVAGAPMGLLEFARNYLLAPDARAGVEKRSRDLYVAALARLVANSNDDESRLFLRRVLSFELEVGQDAKLRADAKAEGLALLHLGSEPQVSIFASPTFHDLAFIVAIEDGDAATFDAAVAQLRKTSDPAPRRQLIGAIGNANGELGAKARDLVFDSDTIRRSEVFQVLGPQSYKPETREEAWNWLLKNGEKLVKLLPEEHAGSLPLIAASHCTDKRADEVQTYFTPLVGKLPGGPRSLASAVEQVRLCAALREKQGPAAVAYFK